MALIQCKECGATMSSKADSCPQCGAKLKGVLGGWGGVLIAFIIMIVVISSLPESKPENDVVTLEQQAVLDILKSDKEPTIKDAAWAGRYSLRVGVIDDGSNRDSFADYVCQVLRDNGINDARVTINNIIKVTRNNDWVELGKSNCHLK